MLVGLVVAGVAVSVPANAGVCFDLWVARNSIYKAYGYCFKTSKAINYFGKAGCLYDNAAAVLISGPDKRRELAIKKREKQLGCL
jgi:hypothetical protein